MRKLSNGRYDVVKVDQYEAPNKSTTVTEFMKKRQSGGPYLECQSNIPCTMYITDMLKGYRILIFDNRKSTVKKKQSFVELNSELRVE